MRGGKTKKLGGMKKERNAGGAEDGGVKVKAGGSVVYETESYEVR